MQSLDIYIREILVFLHVCLIYVWIDQMKGPMCVRKNM